MIKVEKGSQRTMSSTRIEPERTMARTLSISGKRYRLISIMINHIIVVTFDCTRFVLINNPSGPLLGYAGIYHNVIIHHVVIFEYMFTLRSVVSCHCALQNEMDEIEITIAFCFIVLSLPVYYLL